MNKWLSLRRLLRPGRLVGPVFAKELRVASRRRRSYLLRGMYVLLLTIYIAAVWIPAVELPGWAAMSRSQMQVAAHRITQSIIWFQFFGAQIVALILMSTSISEEVHRRTLCVLMTTPLSSFQVVVHKFFSRLFQVFLLVAVSLPMLAVVRVLGGIEWSYLIVSLCVTVFTVLFVGSVSLFFSSLCRRAHLVVFLGALSVVFAFVIVPVLLGWSWQTSRVIPPWLVAMNPYALLKYCSNLTVASPPAVTCCLGLLVAADLLLACSAWLVNRVTLRRAMGEPVSFGRWKTDAGGRRGSLFSVLRPPSSVPRRVVGPPMVWKELTCTLSSRQRFATRLVVGIEILLILIAYLFPMMMGIFSYEFLHLLCVWAFLGLGVLVTIAASASVICAEREAGTWSMLLLTPLTAREILVGKFVGVLRRCGPVWLALLAYVAAFTCAGCFRPMAVVHAALLIPPMVLFLSATGFYFSLRMRRTTDAVTANIVLAGVLWCIVPLLGVALEFGMQGAPYLGVSVARVFVPFVQAFAMVVTTLDGYGGWFDPSLNALGLAKLMLGSLVGYLLVSLVFAWLAVRRFRRSLS